MQRNHTTTGKALLLGLLGVGALAAGAVAWRAARSGQQDLPAAATTPALAWDVVYARPFRVDQPFTHWWRAERPQVDAGWLLVVTAAPDLLVPRETAEPVLFVGDQTAERFNKGHLDGALVAIVPSERDANGAPLLQLEGTPIWFGAAELPERLDAAAIAAEAAAAADAGVVPLPASRVQLARATGGELLHVADRSALDAEAARLVLRFAPGETDFAQGRLVERAR